MLNRITLWRYKFAMDEAPKERRLFHTNEGMFDFSRLIEQLIPGVAIGAIVIYANGVLMQAQLADLRVKVERTEDRMGAQNEKLIALSAQVIAYLAQQNQLNASMSDRLTFIERDRTRMGQR